MSRKERRAQRKAEQDKKKKAKAVKFAEAVMEDGKQAGPKKVEVLPDDEKLPLTEAKFGTLEVPKQAVSLVDGARFGYEMTWCARHADRDGHWSWGEARQWSEQEWCEEIKSTLNGLEKLDWKEIQCMTSDSSHLMHHDQAVSSLCSEAQQRWLDLNLEQFDVSFRFRMGNRKRAWGIELQGHFFLIWYEREHKIYPTGP